jgi:hypothetical protein
MLSFRPLFRAQALTLQLLTPQIAKRVSMLIASGMTLLLPLLTSYQVQAALFQLQQPLQSTSYPAQRQRHVRQAGTALAELLLLVVGLIGRGGGGRGRIVAADQRGDFEDAPV